MAILKPCSVQGCSRTTTAGGRCNEHQREKALTYEKTRPSSSARGYGHRWRVARAEFLRVNPLCAEHLRQNVCVPASEVDHICPHKGDQRLFWDRSNWQALCKSCHSEKTMKDGRFGGHTSELLPVVKPSGVKTTVICGPMHTWSLDLARSLLNEGDLLIDVETIAAGLSHLPLYECADGDVMRRAMGERNRLISCLPCPAQLWKHVAMVTPGYMVSERRHWRDQLGAEVVVLTMPPDICYHAIRGDAQQGKDRRRRMVADWWARYVTDPQDAVLRQRITPSG